MLIREETTPLSAFETLESSAFHLLLDLLGGAMVEASMSGDHRAVRAVSSDGSLEIELSTPLQAGATATLRTSDGLLTGPDYRVAIRPTQTQAALAR